MTELELKLAKALVDIAGIHVGVYPKAFNGVPRTERQTGWNRARAAYAKEIHAVIRNDPTVYAAFDIAESMNSRALNEMQVKVLDTSKEIK